MSEEPVEIHIPVTVVLIVMLWIGLVAYLITSALSEQRNFFNFVLLLMLALGFTAVCVQLENLHHLLNPYPEDG